MPETQRGRYTCRDVVGEGDLGRSLALREKCFTGAGTATAAQGDSFDALCQHVLIEDTATQELICSFRLMILGSGRNINTSYSSQFYDLGALAHFADPILELGRFCIHPDRTDPDILRLAWGHITRLAVTEKVGLLMGCSSFSGTDWQPYQAAFSVLYRQHRAPLDFAPRVKSTAFIDFGALEDSLTAKQASIQTPDRHSDLRGLRQMPSLLRTYLMMGGWVSDHAVIDAVLGTTHVFTAVEVARIPPARLRALMALAG